MNAAVKHNSIKKFNNLSIYSSFVKSFVLARDIRMKLSSRCCLQSCYTLKIAFQANHLFKKTSNISESLYAEWVNERTKI